MRIEVLMVANSASAEDGLLTVHDGGWEHTIPRTLPCTLTGYLAAELASFLVSSAVSDTLPPTPSAG